MDEQPRHRHAQQAHGGSDGEMVDERFGDYELLRRLGEGGMAIAYVARERISDMAERLVCVKQILPQLAADEKFRQMFHDEVRISSLLSHRNICRIYRAGQVGETLYMAMEFVDGLSVADLVEILRARGEDFPIEHALYLVAEVMEGLHAAHTQVDTQGQALGLVHRDISPQNVLVSRRGDVKIIDFGVAKATSNMSHTRTGAVKGKLLYLSPEQLQAVALDARSDVFSAGMMLYEMLTRAHPFRGPDEASTIFNYIAREIDPPSRIAPHVPPALDATVMLALEKDRDRRYPSAAAMARALTDALYQLAPGYRPYHFADFLGWVIDPAAGPMPQASSVGAFAATGAGLGSPTTDPGVSGTVEDDGFAPTVATAAVPRRVDPPVALPSAPALAPASAPGLPRALIVVIALLSLLLIGVVVVATVLLARKDDEAGGDGSDGGGSLEASASEDPAPEGDPLVATGAGAPAAFPGTVGSAAPTLDAPATDTAAGGATAETDPLANDPPASDPPAGDPPASDPPASDPPATDTSAALDKPATDSAWGHLDDTDEDDDPLAGVDDPTLTPPSGWDVDTMPDDEELEADGGWDLAPPSPSGLTFSIGGREIRSVADLDQLPLTGDSKSNFEMLMGVLPEVKGTRLETLYRVTMFASTDSSAMLPLLTILCTDVAARPWNAVEQRVIAESFAGQDPCAWIVVH